MALDFGINYHQSHVTDININIIFERLRSNHVKTLPFDVNISDISILPLLKKSTIVTFHCQIHVAQHACMKH